MYNDRRCELHESRLRSFSCSTARTFLDWCCFYRLFAVRQQRKVYSKCTRPLIVGKAIYSSVTQSSVVEQMNVSSQVDNSGTNKACKHASEVSTSSSSPRVQSRAMNRVCSLSPSTTNYRQTVAVHQMHKKSRTGAIFNSELRNLQVAYPIHFITPCGGSTHQLIFTQVLLRYHSLYHILQIRVVQALCGYKDGQPRSIPLFFLQQKKCNAYMHHGSGVSFDISIVQVV